mgnify:CR=1 FL=1
MSRLWHLYTRESWAKWPASVPAPRPDKPPARVTGDKVRLSFVGHASWLVQAAGRNLLIDPHWSERASPVSFAGPKRVTPPGIPFDDLPPIDAVLVTHNHYDHLDLDTLERIWQRSRPLIVTPLGNDAIIRTATPGAKFAVLDWDQHAEIAPGPKDIVIYKQKPSGFFGTNMASYLTLLGCDSVIVTGTTTSGCVRATVLDAFSLNYRISLAEEGCFDRSQASHAINLCDMNAKYADVVKTAEVLEFFDGLQPGMFDLPKGSPVEPHPSKR